MCVNTQITKPDLILYTVIKGWCRGGGTEAALKSWLVEFHCSKLFKAGSVLVNTFYLQMLNAWKRFAGFVSS